MHVFAPLIYAVHCVPSSVVVRLRSTMAGPLNSQGSAMKAHASVNEVPWMPVAVPRKTMAVPVSALPPRLTLPAPIQHHNAVFQVVFARL